MAIRKSIIRTGVAISAVLIMTALATTAALAQGARGQAPAAAGGQGGGGGRGGRGGPAYTPAAGAKDLKSVLFNWGWYTGMLRSDQEYDVLMSLEYQGKGTMQVDGQPCNLSKYRMSITYQRSGARIQMTGMRR